MIFEKKVLEFYKSSIYTRCDDRGYAYYFSSDDFEGLHKEPYPFSSSLGHRLQGYIYSYSNPISGRIVVFDHGFGGGHRSYMKEIELLCRHGYTVFAYDHTGCMESGGENTNGLAQSLCDLNDCISAIKADGNMGEPDISVMGHSWGGFSTLNICALHPDVSHIIALSGFISVEAAVGSFFSGVMKSYRGAVMESEKKSNPVYSTYNAVKSLENTSAETLLVYSDNDKMCPKNPNYDELYSALSGRDNVSFLLTEGKGHNPNYTADAAAYLAQYLEDQKRLAKKKLLDTPEQRKKFVASYDWNRMTAQDESVWDKIFAVLDK